MSILQEHAGNNDITTIDGIYNVASDVLFPADGLELIDEDYQKRLVTGFTLHYFKDEIGQETLPLWKMSLLEKLVNNCDYINEIYANLDKQIFSDYRVRNVQASGEATGSKTGTGSTSSTKESTATDQGNSTKMYGEDSTDEKTTAQSVGDNVTLTKSGSETRIHGGYDDTVRSGSEVQQNGGTDTNTDNGYNDNISSKGTGTYNNGVNITFDTPVDSLDALRTPGGDVDGNTVSSQSFPNQGRDLDIYQEGGSRGWDYMEDQSYNYMAGAVEQDSTQTTVENGNDKSINHNVSETTHGHKVATTYGKDLAGNTDERKDRTNYNSKDTINYGVNESGNTNARIDTTVAQKTISGTDSGEAHKTGNERTTNSNTNTVEDSVTGTSSTSEATENTHADTTDEIDYNVSMEMVLKSESFLTRLWDLFDDLFINFSY